jgi:hypothetical protein
LDHVIAGSPEVEAGIAEVGVRRQGQVLVDAFDS